MSYFCRQSKVGTNKLEVNIFKGCLLDTREHILYIDECYNKSFFSFLRVETKIKMQLYH